MPAVAAAILLNRSIALLRSRERALPKLLMLGDF